MTIRIASFDPYTASDQLWAAFSETRRAIARQFWPDEPMLDDAETRREVQTTNPMVELRRWVAMEGDEVAGSFRAAFRRPGTPDTKVRRLRIFGQRDKLRLSGPKGRETWA
jgi:hypothetical protein